jgi:hypothetical protein
MKANQIISVVYLDIFQLQVSFQKILCKINNEILLLKLTPEDEYLREINGD